MASNYTNIKEVTLVFINMSSFGSVEDNPLTHADIEEILVAVSGPVSGTDSDDAIYNSIQDLWKKELKAKDKKTGELKWYTQGYDYWENEENCPISDDGVLGRSSHTYIQKYLQNNQNACTTYRRLWESNPRGYS